MRFVLVSTHIDQTTGYSKVAYNLLRQLATLSPKIKVYHFGFQRHPAKSNLRKYPDGIVSYDAAANEDPQEAGFGFNKIREYMDMVNPDVVMIYNDAAIIYNFIEAMKHEPGKSPYKLWTYLDQVYDGIAQPLIDKLRTHADRIYTFTDSWRTKLLGYAPFKDVRVLEHAVDQTLFSRLSISNRKSIRSGMNIPEDSIVFLNANRNSERKRLDLTVAGFARALASRPDLPIYLILATGINPQSGAHYDIQRIYMLELERAGLPIASYVNRLMLVDTSPPNVIGDEAINQIYNAADIGINTADGEGFGLCQLEHLYTGAPQVVTDVGSYRAFLNEDVAMFIPVEDRSYFAGGMPLGAWAARVSTQSVCNAMINMAENLPKYKEAVTKHSFKTWSGVCDGLLEDILTLQAGDQVATGFALVKS